MALKDKEIKLLQKELELTRLSQQSTSASSSVIGNASYFTFKDIKDNWLLKFEQNAEILRWNSVQKLVYARRLLKGSALQSTKTGVEISSYEDKEFLKKEFEKNLSSVEIHKKMSQRKKNRQSHWKSIL